jgi:hypothetical protein
VILTLRRSCHLLQTHCSSPADPLLVCDADQRPFYVWNMTMPIETDFLRHAANRLDTHALYIIARQSSGPGSRSPREKRSTRLLSIWEQRTHKWKNTGSQCVHGDRGAVTIRLLPNKKNRSGSITASSS